MDNAFHVELHYETSAALLILTGELDLASAAELEAALEIVWASDVELVIIDLRALEFMDSTGIRTVIQAHQRAQEDDRRLALVDGTAQVQKVLDITNVLKLLTVVETPEELLRDQHASQ